MFRHGSSKPYSLYFLHSKRFLNSRLKKEIFHFHADILCLSVICKSARLRKTGDISCFVVTVTCLSFLLELHVRFLNFVCQEIIKTELTNVLYICIYKYIFLNTSDWSDVSLYVRGAKVFKGCLTVISRSVCSEHTQLFFVVFFLRFCTHICLPLSSTLYYILHL